MGRSGMKLFFCGLFIFFIRLGNGQEVDNQLWLDYNLTVPITNNLSWGGDAGLRGLVSNSNWNQLIIRPALRYRFNQTFAVAGAAATFMTFNQDTSNVFEYRLHQELNIRWPDFGFLALFYRLRLEQRYFDLESQSSEFKVRVRYLAGIETRDFTLLGKKRPFYFQGIWEGFKTIGDDAEELFINQVRIHAVFGHRITPLIRYELHYKWQRSRQFVENGLETTQNVFRIRVFHRLRDREERKIDKI